MDASGWSRRGLVEKRIAVKRFWAQLAIATNWPVLLAVLLLSAMGLGQHLGGRPRFGR